MIRIFVNQWNELKVTKTTSIMWCEQAGFIHELLGGNDYIYGSHLEVFYDDPFIECDEPCYCGIAFPKFSSPYPAGWYRIISTVFHGKEFWGDGYHDVAVTMTDFYYDPE